MGILGKFSSINSTTTNGNGGRGYKKIDEDTEEKKHRQAQFLIYKTLQQADHKNIRRATTTRAAATPVSRRTKLQQQRGWILIKICKLKLKIKRRLKRMRRAVLVCFSSTIAAGRASISRSSHMSGPLIKASWRRLLLHCSGSTILHLPQPRSKCLNRI